MASSVQNNRVSNSGNCMCCRTCRMWCWKAFKWLPVMLILAIIIWSYYAYVIQLCIFTIESTVQQCIYLVIHHILLIMFCWSYARTVFADIKPIPERSRWWAARSRGDRFNLYAAYKACKKKKRREVLLNCAKLTRRSATVTERDRSIGKYNLVLTDAIHYSTIQMEKMKNKT